MFEKTMVLPLLISACGDPAPQVPQPKPQSVELPAVKVEGRNYTYIEYHEVTEKTESRGRAFFLYPLTNTKNKLSALEYTPGMNMKDLFADDVIGISGLASREGPRVRVEFLPISIPIGIAAGQEWQMQYAKREFICRSALLPVASGRSQQIVTTCVNGDYTLKFQFDRNLGVTEFQDFCNFSICTYKLAGPHGLLSRSMTDFMGLPRI